MIRFSEHYKLGLSQPELDFVDIPLDEDLPVYLDPFAISLFDDELSSRASRAVIDFFQTTISALRSGDEHRAQKMLQRLSEPNETHLGVSSGRPQGRGVGGRQAFDLYKSIASSKAAKSGLVEEIAECDLFIDGIGPDKISDMVTNILRRELTGYTQRQCELHNINIDRKVPTGFIWDDERIIWREEYANLPIYNGSRLLLIPKSFVRRSLALNSQDYLNKHVLEYLQAEHLSAGSSLVELLVNGKRRVTKKSLKETYPCNKDWMAEFSSKNPSVLENYKRIAKEIALKERKKEADALNGEYDEAVFAVALIDSLRLIKTGNATASAYHNIMIGIIEFLFWPHLINPEKEKEIHDGRKRIDISYTNSARDGFFLRTLNAAQIAAVKVPVECKNYSKDPANPEVDQIAGRFSPVRGWFGIMVYRETSDYKLLVNRCRDTALDRRGFILPLGDPQIIDMLQDVADGRRGKIDDRLSEILDMIIH